MRLVVSRSIQNAVAHIALMTLTGMPLNVLAADFMDCGTAPLCGVLALETGLGSGAYNHETPTLHGLWPETGRYGSSSCVRPNSIASPAKLYSCYIPSSGGSLDFEKHEWKKHGRCAGVRDADDYFEQACELSREPLRLMSEARAAGASNLGSFRSRLESAGYPVHATDQRNMQIELPACANSEGRWMIARPSQFSQVCAARFTEPVAPAPLGQCVRNQKGPVCGSNADCGYSGCVRCAKSGFCTDQALPRQPDAR